MRKIRMRHAGVVWIALTASPTLAAPQFMKFPVPGYSAFSSGIIITVLDHEVPHSLTNPFGKDGPYGTPSGAVLSFTGELFVATRTYPTKNQGCYPKAINSHQTSSWRPNLSYPYSGTSSDRCTAGVALNYDNHPGYDYRISSGTGVFPVYKGHIVSTRCINTFSNGKSCDDMGAVAVDHGNGFITQYLHMTRRNYGSAAQGRNQDVTRDYRLGTVSDIGVPGRVHLHFEVLQRKSTPVNKANYYDRANYVIVDPYGYRAGSYYADRLLSNPGCLWAEPCKY